MKKILHIILILGSAVLQGQKYQDVGQFTPRIYVGGMVESNNNERFVLGANPLYETYYKEELIGDTFNEDYSQIMVLKLNEKNELLDYGQIICTTRGAIEIGGSSNNLVINNRREMFFAITSYKDSLIYRGELLSYAPDSSSNLGGVIGMDSDLNIIFKKFFPQDVFVQSVETWNDRVYVLGYFGGDSVMMIVRL
ncbi:MAG: hypothetical protein H6572_07855 [Lewinellaceae bacterium]|nr:hypothetical protein [Lewinellaceae bacterium]